MKGDITQKFRPAFLWFVLHKNAEAWARHVAEGRQPDQLRPLDAEDRTYFSELSSYDVHRWIKLCDALGMTGYGAAALSWCKDATLPQVLDGWRASGFPLKPLPEYERPARFINPNLLPKSRKLSVLAGAAHPDPFALCVMIAHDATLEFDVTVDWLRQVTDPQLIEFLHARLQGQSALSDAHRALIEEWGIFLRDMSMADAGAKT